MLLNASDLFLLLRDSSFLPASGSILIDINLKMKNVTSDLDDLLLQLLIFVIFFTLSFSQNLVEERIKHLQIHLL